MFVFTTPWAWFLLSITLVTDLKYENILEKNCLFLPWECFRHESSSCSMYVGKRAQFSLQCEVISYYIGTCLLWLEQEYSVFANICIVRGCQVSFSYSHTWKKLVLREKHLTWIQGVLWRGHGCRKKNPVNLSKASSFIVISVWHSTVWMRARNIYPWFGFTEGRHSVWPAASSKLPTVMICLGRDREILKKVFKWDEQYRAVLAALCMNNSFLIS